MPSITSDRQELVDACEQLRRSNRGRGALEALACALHRLHGLDLYNRNAVLTLLRGFFGDFPSTVEEIVKDEAELCDQQRTASLFDWSHHMPRVPQPTATEWASANFTGDEL